MYLGYARVSTPDQSLDHQLDALRRYGVDQKCLYVDVASGARAQRPQLDALTRALRPADTLVVTRLDRLGRSLVHLVNFAELLRERGVNLVATEQAIDTTTPEGRVMFGVFGILAEVQRDLIVANTRDGLAAARARGRVGGRKPKLTPAQVRHAQELYDSVPPRPVAEIARLFGVPRTTLYHYLNTSPEDQR